jgi:DMSO/TMAO reductase YedYZ molybdopterin-dependent catalytic subunit
VSVHARQVIKPDPLNAEAPLRALDAAVTPLESHYVRSNFATPTLPTASYRLAVTGAVERAIEYDWSELTAFTAHELTVTMECAGNDRLGMRPVPAGEPWSSGAVSTALWRGVRFADVLERAGVSPSTCEIVVHGADQGERRDAETPAPVPFARSLPVDVAMHPDTLLATQVNGTALPPAHGAPVRLVVPGWYGMANVKWVTRLEAVTTPFAGYFQSRRYVYDEPAGVMPVTRMRVKSLISAPLDQSVLAPGPLEIRGWAWSGTGRVVQVEVATGDANSWQPATLGVPAGPHAWTPWRYVWEHPPAGRVTLQARATDASGAVQPPLVTWNRLGYGNNAVRPITVYIQE